MEKLKITKADRLYFEHINVEVINNAKGAVFFHGSMYSVTAAVSRLLERNPGVEVRCMNTEIVDVANRIDTRKKSQNSAIIDASVIFYETNRKDEE